MAFTGRFVPKLRSSLNQCCTVVVKRAINTQSKAGSRGFFANNAISLAVGASTVTVGFLALNQLGSKNNQTLFLENVHAATEVRNCNVFVFKE